MRKVLVFLSAILLILAVSCDGGNSNPNSSKPNYNGQVITVSVTKDVPTVNKTAEDFNAIKSAVDDIYKNFNVLYPSTDEIDDGYYLNAEGEVVEYFDRTATPTVSKIGYSSTTKNFTYFYPGTEYRLGGSSITINGEKYTQSSPEFDAIYAEYTAMSDAEVLEISIDKAANAASGREGSAVEGVSAKRTKYYISKSNEDTGANEHTYIIDYEIEGEYSGISHIVFYEQNKYESSYVEIYCIEIVGGDYAGVYPSDYNYSAR